MTRQFQAPVAVLAALSFLPAGLLAGDQKDKDADKTASADQTVEKKTKAKKEKEKSPGDKKKDPDAIGNRDIDKGINFYSLEKEIGLGKQLAQEVERQAKVIDDPVIAEYVSRVGQNLVRNSDAKVPFTIKVLDTEEVNAFALPGGFFFVNSGLILKAESEAELAGVMAHESRTSRRATAPSRPPAANLLTLCRSR